jgi:hypothetical protein
MDVDLVWWLKTIIPAAQEAEIRRIMVPDQPGQKVSKTPSQQNKSGVVTHACHPAMWEAIGRRITV